MPTLEEAEVPFVDVLAPDGAQRFTDRSRELLEAGTWLIRTPLWFSVLDHDGVRALQKEPRLHTLGVRLVEMQGITEGLLHERASDNILALEGEPHTRLRGLVSRAFTPRAVERLRPLMRDWLEARLDRLDQSAPFDFMAEIAEEYPIAVICAMVGAPPEDWPRFSAWATAVFKQFQFNLAQDRPEVERALMEIADYTDALIDERRHGADASADDLISDLLAVEEDGDRVTPEEIRSLVTSLLLAGTDTTRNQLGLGILLLAQRPDQWQLLVDDPSRVPAAVEEILRFDPTAGATPRVVAEEFTFRGLTFTPGTAVALMSISANRDPSAGHRARRLRHHRGPGRLLPSRLRQRAPLLPRRQPRPGRADRGADRADPTLGGHHPGRRAGDEAGRRHLRPGHPAPQRDPVRLARMRTARTSRRSPVPSSTTTGRTSAPLSRSASISGGSSPSAHSQSSPQRHMAASTSQKARPLAVRRYSWRGGCSS